ncbi:FAD-dependent oxidoreductase [archaeon]|nr:MAG: FAD-dependent oxidoreductase [archaeon]
MSAGAFPCESLGRQRRIAVVGGGAAGCAALYALAQSEDNLHITLFEAAAQVGGHAHTVEVCLRTQSRVDACGVE